MGEAKLDLDSWIKLIHPDDLASVNVALESCLLYTSDAADE